MLQDGLPERSEGRSVGQREKSKIQSQVTVPQPIPWELRSWDEGEGPGPCVSTETSHWMHTSPGSVCVTLSEGNSVKCPGSWRQGHVCCITVSTTVDIL